MNKILTSTIVVLLMAVAAYAKAEEKSSGKKHLFILSGQSNMTGGLAASFTETVEKVLGKENVITVHYNRPGQPIKEWYVKWTPPEGGGGKAPARHKDGPNGGMYQVLMQKVKALTKDKPLATVTLIWMQGEADAQNGWGSVYEKSFLGLLDQFKSDMGITEMNFVVGRINDYWVPPGTVDGDLVRSILKNLGETHKNGAWVDTDDLNRGVNPWGGYSLCDGHMPSQGYRVLGQRFARKAIALVAPDQKIDEEIFHHHFFDSTDDVKSHLALNKKVTCAGKELPQLTDGAYGSMDPKDGKWVALGAAQTSVELLLDLGKVEKIDSLCVNLLVNPVAKVDLPLSVTFALSEDGQAFQELGKEGIKFFGKDQQRPAIISKMAPQSLLVLTEPEKGKKSSNTSKAQYIKVILTKSTDCVYLDEILINPVAK